MLGVVNPLQTIIIHLGPRTPTRGIRVKIFLINAILEHVGMQFLSPTEESWQIHRGPYMALLSLSVSNMTLRRHTYPYTNFHGRLLRDPSPRHP